MTTLILPYPPSANKIYRHTRHGVMLSSQTKKFRQQVSDYIEQIWPVGFATIKGDLHVEVALSPPARIRRRDIDNPIKSLFDALTHAGIWEDDSQVSSLLVTFATDAAPGVATVRILPAARATL